MAVTVEWAMTCTITETVSGNTDSVNSRDLEKTFTHDAFNEHGTLTAATAVPATKAASFLMALSAGAYTINLASIPSLNNALVDGTGLKLQILRIKNLGAAAMTFAEGASNGYALGSSIVVKPGGIEMLFGNDGMPDIASGDRTIDVAGTAAQTAEVTIVLG